MRYSLLSVFDYCDQLLFINRYILQLYKYFSKVYDRTRKEKIRNAISTISMDTCQGRFIRLSTKFQVQCSWFERNTKRFPPFLARRRARTCCTDRNSCRIRYLQLAGPSGWTVRQHILYEYPGYVLWLAGAAIVQIDLERRIWKQKYWIDDFKILQLYSFSFNFLASFSNVVCFFF